MNSCSTPGTGGCARPSWRLPCGKSRPSSTTSSAILANTPLAWRQIQSAEHRAQRKRQIVEALMNYRAERDAWDSLF